MNQITNSKPYDLEMNQFKLLGFNYCNLFRISCLVFSIFLLYANTADAALIVQAPKYIGLNSGLVGYWSFNGPDMNATKALDTSGQGNHGTLTNGPARAIGKLGQALSFDGSNDYVNLGSPATLRMETNLTVSAWIYPTAAFCDNCRIYNHGIIDVAPYNEYALITGSNGKIRFEVTTGAGAGSYTALDSLTSPSLNTWTHAIVTYDGGTMKVYLNGVLDNSTAKTGTISVADNDSVIGGNPTQLRFTGIIDDVRIYNRALSGDEIKRLYRIGATLKVNKPTYSDSLQNGLVGSWSFDAPDIAGTTAYDRSGQGKNGSSLGQDISRSGLVGWWKLDEGSGTNAADSSGQGNNGTLAVGPTWGTGKIGSYALNFTDNNYAVNLGDSASLRFGTGNFTIAVWIKPSTLDGPDEANNLRMIAKNNYPTNWWVIDLPDGDNDNISNISFQTKDDSGNGGTTTSTGELVSINTWTHIVIVYDRGNSLAHYYRNGNLDSSPAISAAFTGTLNIAGLNVYLGSDTWNNFSGLIDDVRIYNRAISAAEVAQLYAYGLPKFAPAVGKIGQGIDSTQSYVNPGNVNSSVNSFAFWLKTASSSPTVNLLDLNAGQNIKIVAGTVTASGITSPSIFVDGVSASTVNSGWHHIAVTTGTAVNASAVNLGLNATTTAPLDGALDDVRFYNRVINTDEIKRLYRIGATLKVNTDVSRDNPDLERGLVGYWSFNGADMAGNTAYDRSGNANNGTLTNGPIRAIGKIGQALSFDGVNDGIDLGTSASLDLNSGHTLSAWVYTKTPKSAAISTNVVALGSASCCGTEQSLAANYSGGGGTYRWNMSQTGLILDGTTEIVTNRWYHIVGTWDGATASIYVDGVKEKSQAHSTAITEFSNQSYIGRDDSTAHFFNGSIDDVRVYNRVLSADEIKRLYNIGR